MAVSAARLVSWASILDDVTREQAELSATMPFIQPYLALMPDAHLGKGATVGSVIPTVGCIMPAAVGVDIGCGMIAIRTFVKRADLAGRDLSVLRREIERAIPLGAGRENGHLTDTARVRVDLLEHRAPRDYTETMTSRRNGQVRVADWRLQLGTLGGGNHFIEVSIDEEDVVWLFLHSGSRGIGNKIANEHIRVAKRLHGADVPAADTERNLAWLDEGTPEFDAYIADLRWAQYFALINREEMMTRVLRQFYEWMDEAVAATVVDVQVNCHHNFTEMLEGADLESWASLARGTAWEAPPGDALLEDLLQRQEDGNQAHVWLSRKGAIAAHEGEWGLIPGSMGTASYVVQGKGHWGSFHSSPHGAGRAFGRNAARREFTMKQLEESMQGIEWSHDDAFLDEIPAAYKPIDVVMADAADLVEVRHTLRQLVNVKGE